MGIPFRGYYEGVESVLEERVKEGAPRSNQRHGFRDGESQDQRLREERQRSLMTIRAEAERYRRSIEEEAERYIGVLDVPRSVQETGRGPRAQSRRQESMSERDSLIETIIEVHRSRMRDQEMQGDGQELVEETQREVDEESMREACHRFAEQIHTYLRNVGLRVRSFSQPRQSDEFAFAFQAVQVMVGHRNHFDVNQRLNNEYSPMGNYSVDSLANRLMRIWRREMHTSSEQILERFHRAVEDGNLTAVFQTVAIMRSSLGVVGPTGDTALHLACLHGHTDVAQFLLDMGHSPDPVDEDGATPLHDAAAGGYVSILELLLEKAPECVGMSDNDGDSPLHNAARGDHCDCVSILLDAGADPGCTNSMSLRPIDLTTHGSRTYTRLLEASRDVPIRNPDRNS